MLPEILKDHATASAVDSAFADAVVTGDSALGEVTLWIDPAHIVAVCRFLKNEQKFIRLSTITAIDWHLVEPRFEVVYHLHSLDKNERIRLKCKLPGENPEIDSVTSVWRGANWYEREVFDLFGIGFRNHPNLTRILLPLDWEGHPLRKDYPVHGYKYSYPTAE
ncbi:MAG: NADH-quinone oxidoreductase subunit C [Bryobacteraceae bacterium]